MKLTGFNQLQALGKSMVQDYRTVKRQASQADQQPKDRDALVGRVDFVSRDGSHIQADLHRLEEYASLCVSKDAPQAGIQSSSISYEEHPSRDQLEVTMVNINDDEAQHRSQVNLTVNMRTGVIGEFTRTDWNPADIA